MKRSTSKTQRQSKTEQAPRKSSVNALNQRETRQSNKPLDVTFGEVDAKNERELQRKSQVESKKSCGKSNQEVFKGLVFFVEVFEDQISMIESISAKIIEHGGKVVKQLTKQVDYFVFQQGRSQSLSKSLSPDFANVTLINPQWIDACLQAGVVLSEVDQYQPRSLERIIREAPRHKSSKLSEINNEKKRGILRQSEGDESFNSQSQQTSKRKIKASAKSKLADQSVVMADPIEEDSNSEYDEDEINRIVQHVQDERFFRKEFQKDLKKFAKIQAELDQEDSGSGDQPSKKPKKDVRHMTKNQLIDSYIDGDIELPDFIAQMTQRMKNRKAGKHGASRKAPKGNKRLTELFNPKPQAYKAADVTFEQEGDKLNKSAFVTLQDFLFDIDKEQIPLKENKGPKQTMLEFGSHNIQEKHQLSLLNYQPVNLMIEASKSVVGQRITKSSTFNQSKQVDPANHQQDAEMKMTDHKFMFPVNAFQRRTQSLVPSKSFQMIITKSPGKENQDINQMEVQIERSMQKKMCQSGHKLQNNRKRKEWDKILPHRNVPTRVAKLNVSYIEEQEDVENDLNGRFGKTKRRNPAYLY